MWLHCNKQIICKNSNNIWKTSYILLCDMYPYTKSNMFRLQIADNLFDTGDNISEWYDNGFFLTFSTHRTGLA